MPDFKETDSLHNHFAGKTLQCLDTLSMRNWVRYEETGKLGERLFPLMSREGKIRMNDK